MLAILFLIGHCQSLKVAIHIFDLLTIPIFSLSTKHVLCRILLAGVPQYGLVVHPQKVVVNFKPEGTDSFPDIRVLPPHCLFPWCGLLLDTYSLDIYKDYSRWSIAFLGSQFHFRVHLSSPPGGSHWLAVIFSFDWNQPNHPFQLNFVQTHKGCAWLHYSSRPGVIETWHFSLILQFCRVVCSLQPESGLFSLCWTTDEEKADVHPQTKVPCLVCQPQGQKKKNNLINFSF